MRRNLGVTDWYRTVGAVLAYPPSALAGTARITSEVLYIAGSAASRTRLPYTKRAFGDSIATRMTSGCYDRRDVCGS
jgi:hypothetical protein